MIEEEEEEVEEVFTAHLELRGRSGYIITPRARSFYTVIIPVGNTVTICAWCEGEGHFDSCFECGNRGYFMGPE